MSKKRFALVEGTEKLQFFGATIDLMRCLQRKMYYLLSFHCKLGSHGKSNRLFQWRPLVLGVSFLLSVLVFVPLFFLTEMHKPYSFVLYDKQGILLGASVSDDGQWRFPPNEVPEQFEKALICFEDKRFYTHFGVDPFAIMRAMVSNIQEKRIVSGASTLTMQTVRLLQNNPPRTFLQKIKEAFLAVLFEVRYTKKQILSLYAANAPFGGNVVGIEAASWRYFNRPPDSLSWAETAMLAVLPNRPSDVHPGANRDLLLERRNDLLYAMCKNGIISNETFEYKMEDSNEYMGEF